MAQVLSVTTFGKFCNAKDPLVTFVTIFCHQVSPNCVKSLTNHMCIDIQTSDVSEVPTTTTLLLGHMLFKIMC